MRCLAFRALACPTSIPRIRQYDAPSDVEDYRLCQGRQLVRVLCVGRTRPATKLSKHGIRYRGIDISDK